MDCIFCKIMAGEIPSERIYEDDKMVIIKDIDPKAARHYLCIPKSHFQLLSEMNAEQSDQLNHCFQTIPLLAEKLGLTNGYRLIVNQGDRACPTFTSICSAGKKWSGIPHKFSVNGGDSLDSDSLYLLYW